MQIKGALVDKVNDVQLKQIELAEPENDEVLIKLVGTGICHTDISVLNQDVETPLPIVLGHEGAGIVEKTGSGVTEFEKGDHVVIAFAFCEECNTCKKGMPGSCEKLGELNFDGVMRDGHMRMNKNDEKVATLFGQSSLATYSLSHKSNLVKVDKDIDLSILGPLGCGIQTGAGTVTNVLKPEFATSIAIFGCGAVGLSGIMAAAQVGCDNVIAIDVNQDRLNLAKELGATHILNGNEDDVLGEINKITDGNGAEYSFDTTGVPPVVLQAVRCLAVDGTVAVVAVGGEVPIHIHSDLVMPNRTIIGVTEGLSIPSLYIPQLIDQYKKGKFPFDKLIKKYAFEDLHNALDDMKSGKTIKPVITF